MKPSISVILTSWARPQYLEEQVERILNQSVKPVEIILWYNKPPNKLGIFERKQLIRFKNDRYVKKILCDYNFGIVPRFTLASCLEGEYVCIFDDDTMPAERWFENCLEHVDKDRVICGTIGLRYLSRTDLKTEKPRMGWEAMNRKLEIVDTIGHCWFFRREWARFFWDEEPLMRTFGEDIHFCAMLQRHGIRSACPPHPSGDRSLWGSVKPELGVDNVAISVRSDRSMDFWKIVRHELERGFKPVLLSPKVTAEP
ncbi:MAG: glycosyltransferase [Deltaproteobacteria bacterium]|nr:glycosyltransferase [Deltaproteobacteria bacterium]